MTTRCPHCVKRGGPVSIGYEGPEPWEQLRGDDRYYQTPVEPKGSPIWIYNRLSLPDRLEIASDCFQAGHFDWRGEISCVCSRRPRLCPTQFGLMYTCEMEYWCECFAVFITMPQPGFEARVLDFNVLQMAKMYEIPDWAVRFRMLLMQGYGFNSLGEKEMAYHM